MITLQKADAALSAAQAGDPKPLSAIIPDIICRGEPGLASYMVTQRIARDNVLPELLTLFNARNRQYRDEVAMINGFFIRPPEARVDLIGRACTRIGAYGFSFPKWRHLTQGYDGASLAERFGMTKLQRDTDVRDASLPDPHRDELGLGFKWSDKDWYIEYRRAYILIASKSDFDPTALVIRNNSYFFGRDRLDAPAYISWKNLGESRLKSLTAEKLAENFERFELLPGRGDLPDYAKFQRINRLLDRLDKFDSTLHKWLWHDGKQQFADFLQSRPAGRTPYIAKVSTNMPPWFTKPVFQATPDLATSGALTQLFNTLKPAESLVLTTGRRGDFPIKPQLR